MAIDVDELRARPLDPVIADELDIFERTRRASTSTAGRRGRLPGLPPEPRRLRPAPGRPQPDAAGEGPARPGHARAARDARLHRRDLLARAGATSPPARTCSSTSSSSSRRPRSCACSASVGLTCAKRAATPCATSSAATSPARARTRCSTSRRGPRRPPTASCATRTRSACPASSRSTSRAARPTAARRCSTTSASIAITRTLADGTTEAGFKVFVAGGLGANPHPAQALEEFTAREDLLPTIEACLRTFDHYGNRDNKLRARMKWLVDTMGIDELRERIIKERKFLRGVGDLAGRHPRAVRRGAATRRPAIGTDGRGRRRRAGRAPRPRRRTAAGTWPTSCAAAPTARSARSRTAALGDITTEQFRRARRRSSATSTLDVRITNRQNFALRDLTEADLRGALRPAASRSAWPSPAPSSPATSSAAPAPTPATSRSRSRAASPPPSATRSRTPASPRSAACASTSPAARTAAASTTSPTSGSSGSSAARTAAPRPATRCCSAATSATWRSSSARRPRSCRPRPRPKRSCGSSAASPTSAAPARRSPTWLARSGGAAGVGDTLKDLDDFPTPEDGPDFFVDYDETGPYVAEVGDERVRDMSDAPSVTPRHRRRRPSTGRSSTSTSASSPRSRAELEHKPASAVDRVGVGALRRPASCSRRRSRTACSSTSRCKAVPDIEVVFLDTQYHFAETLWYVEQVRERYDLNLTVMQPRVRARRPLADRPRRVLPRCARSSRSPARSTARQAWMTGLRRVETPGPGQRADRAPRRRPRHREGQPARDVDRRRRRRLQAGPRPPRAPARRRRATRRSAAGRAPVPSARARTPAPAAGPARDKTECGLHGE